MKIKSLLAGMFACAALVACSNNDLVEGDGGNQPLEGDAYLAVSIVNPITSRATAGNEDPGTAAENKVEKASFVLFDQQGNYVTHVSVTGAELELNEGNKYESKAVLVLDNAAGVTATQIIAFLNPPTGLNMTQSLSKLMKDAGDYGYKEGNFVMSNSAYRASSAIQVATSIDGYVETSAELALKKPVNIYVERVLAKVDVTNNLTTTPVTEIIDGKEVELEAQIVGWALSGTNKESYILKNMAPTYENWAYGLDNSFRSFWAEDVNYESFASSQTEDFTFNSYNGVATQPATSYCLENTLTATAYNGSVAYTHLLVTAKIYDRTNRKDITTFCSYNGAYYMEESLKNVFVAGLSEYKNNANEAITAADIKFVPVDATSTKAYMAKAEFKTPSNFSEEAKAALAAKGQFIMYFEGKSYFWTAIEHFGGTPEDKTGAIGVVRNHVYKLSLNTMTGLGTPVVDPEKPIIPEKPTDDNSYLAAKVHILSWKIVNQGVDLK